MKRGRMFGVLGAVLCATSGVAQSFNIDLDIFGGAPELGNGAPSDAFGAAANQPGRWNRVGLTERGPVTLLDTSGTGTAVTFAYSTNGGPAGGVGFANPANTGDYALLLNDAAQVGSIITGGHATYTFAGLSTGIYDVFTYAVLPSGAMVSVPVTIPQANSSQTQVVTGPMPGNSFAYLVTHSIHRVTVAPGQTVHVDVVQPPSDPNGHAYFLNGFQIAVVPETQSLRSLSLLAGMLWVRSVFSCRKSNQNNRLKERRE